MEQLISTTFDNLSIKITDHDADEIFGHDPSDPNGYYAKAIVEIYVRFCERDGRVAKIEVNITELAQNDWWPSERDPNCVRLDFEFETLAIRPAELEAWTKQSVDDITQIATLIRNNRDARSEAVYEQIRDLETKLWEEISELCLSVWTAEDWISDIRDEVVSADADKLEELITQAAESAVCERVILAGDLRNAVQEIRDEELMV